MKSSIRVRWTLINRKVTIRQNIILLITYCGKLSSTIHSLNLKSIKFFPQLSRISALFPAACAWSGNEFTCSTGSRIFVESYFKYLSFCFIYKLSKYTALCSRNMHDCIILLEYFYTHYFIMMVEYPCRLRKRYLKKGVQC